MIKSMTGFGRSESINEDRKIIVEMKSVNHRYSEFGIKIPRKLNMLEGNIRSLLKEYIDRGKVDVFVTYEDYREGNMSLRYNETLAGEYFATLQKIADHFSVEMDVAASQLSRYPDVLTLEEQSQDQDQIWSQLEEVLRDATENFVRSREIEGMNLQNDLVSKLDEMIQDVGYIQERSPQLVDEYRSKLYDKMKELLDNTAIDENRILAETAIFADKVCVDEELVRLKSHFDTMRQALIDGGSVGRKLDFIAQEMNREANTILSKSNDLDISNRAINLKTSIEKVREQIQNIE